MKTVERFIYQYCIEGRTYIVVLMSDGKFFTTYRERYAGASN